MFQSNTKRAIALLLTISTTVTIWKHVTINDSKKNRNLQTEEGQTINLNNGDASTNNLLPDATRQEILQHDYTILSIGANIGSSLSASYYLTKNVITIHDVFDSPVYLSRCIKKELKQLESRSLDYIILEYSECTDDLYNLARKLRVRYPFAKIIVASLFNPLHIKYKGDDGSELNVKQWSYNQGFTYKSEEAFLFLLQSIKDNHWVLSDRTLHKQCLSKISNEIPSTYILMKENDGNIDSLKFNMGDGELVKKLASERLFMYNEDWDRLNSDGQMDLARGLAETMKFIGYDKNGHDVFGPWLEDDTSCGV